MKLLTNSMLLHQSYSAEIYSQNIKFALFKHATYQTELKDDWKEVLVKADQEGL